MRDMCQTQTQSLHTTPYDSMRETERLNTDHSIINIPTMNNMDATNRTH